MTNSARGEVKIEIGGQSFTFCATVGALARIEGALGIHSTPVILRERVGVGSVGACMLIMQECLTDQDKRDDIASLVCNVNDLASAVMDIFRASGMLAGDGGDEGNAEAQE